MAAMSAASMMVDASSIAALAFPFADTAHSSAVSGRAHPLCRRLGRCTGPSFTRRNISADIGAGGDLRTLADGDVILDSDLGAQHDKILKRRTSGNTTLGDQHA